jgi:hypothetical protein
VVRVFDPDRSGERSDDGLLRGPASALNTLGSPASALRGRNAGPPDGRTTPGQIWVGTGVAGRVAFRDCGSLDRRTSHCTTPTHLGTRVMKTIPPEVQVKCEQSLYTSGPTVHKPDAGARGSGLTAGSWQVPCPVFHDDQFLFGVGELAVAEKMVGWTVSETNTNGFREAVRCPCVTITVPPRDRVQPQAPATPQTPWPGQVASEEKFSADPVGTRFPRRPKAIASPSMAPRPSHLAWPIAARATRRRSRAASRARSGRRPCSR